MVNQTLLSSKFAEALPYALYVATGSTEQQRRWQQVYDSTRLTAEQRKLVESFGRQINLLILSGVWCGDCIQQVPLLQRIAEANASKIQVRLLDRDQYADLMQLIRVNAGNRVPIVLFLAEDHEFCSLAGDRTLSRYRALARRQLGAACPIAIAPSDPNEQAATLQDWLDEFERVHLMLRLSPRLRQKHGD